MASLGINKGPYELDYKLVSHRGAKVTTILNTPYFDNMSLTMTNTFAYDVGFIPEGYEHNVRNDLLYMKHRKNLSNKVSKWQDKETQ